MLVEMVVADSPVLEGIDDLLDDRLADVRARDGLHGSRLPLCGGPMSTSRPARSLRCMKRLTFSRVVS